MGEQLLHHPFFIFENHNFTLPQSYEEAKSASLAERERSLEATHNLIDWIALSLITGVGSRTAANLLDKFGSPAASFNASTAALEFAGIKREVIDQLKSLEPRLRAEEELKKV